MKHTFEIIKNLKPLKAEFDNLVTDGYIFSQVHPKYPIRIYNYAKKTTYNAAWNKLTLMARGLVLDVDYNILARPPVKFFNHSELDSDRLPNLDFEAFEKMDGSLGIGFWYKDEFIVSSRGSFNSDQSLKAQQLIKKYPYKNLPKGFTYIFEIIYPLNQIVVNYGKTEDLVLLLVINTKTGKELSYADLNALKGFKIVKRYADIKSFADFEKADDFNREGYVLRFANGFRMKWKFPKYIRDHASLTMVSTKTIWRALKNGDNFDDIIDKLPDEVYGWFDSIKNGLINDYDAVYNKCTNFCNDFLVNTTEKMFAIEVNNTVPNKRHRKIIFAIKRKKLVAVNRLIWDLVEPEFRKPQTILKDE